MAVLKVKWWYQYKSLLKVETKAPFISLWTNFEHLSALPAAVLPLHCRAAAALRSAL